MHVRFFFRELCVLLVLNNQTSRPWKTITPAASIATPTNFTALSLLVFSLDHWNSPWQWHDRNGFLTFSSGNPIGSKKKHGILCRRLVWSSLAMSLILAARRRIQIPDKQWNSPPFLNPWDGKSHRGHACPLPFCASHSVLPFVGPPPFTCSAMQHSSLTFLHCLHRIACVIPRCWHVALPRAFITETRRWPHAFLLSIDFAHNLSLGHQQWTLHCHNPFLIKICFKKI